MATPAIEVEAVSKLYRITQGAAHRTLREAVTDAIPLGRRRDNAPHVTEFQALRNVSFEVGTGEIVGMIGGNGAGKSTMLKILSRITKPSSGRVVLRGRVGSLLEVGTGFHPELTGRENILLNGAILGMSKREIASKFDEIVAFAEISEFLDTPVKRYSSGMYVRLAFAVAAHLEPEILLVDEVLAVGDATFQRKCLGKMGEVARQGRTILLVSHNMAAITRLCQRVLWLDHGELRGSGNTGQVVPEYLRTGAQDTGEVLYGNNGQSAPGSEFVQLKAVRIRDSEGMVSSAVDARLPFRLEVQYNMLKRASNLRVGMRVIAHDGTIVLSSTDMDSQDEFVREPGAYVSRCDVPGEFLNYGQYYISVGCDFPMVAGHFLVEQALAFQVAQTGGVGGHINDGRLGLLRLRLPWRIEKVGS
jgi:lipopolysaccharide transport system ATP-binding protein